MNPSNRSTAARLVVSLALVLGVSSLALGDTYKTEALKEAAPKSVSKDIGKLLREKGTRVLDPKGKSFVDIWLRKEVDPTGDRSELGIEFGKLPEGTVLGVVKYHAKGYDFRDNKIPEGVYTIRYGVQPADGDHLGVSETRDFVLLSPIKEDKKPDALGYDDLVKLAAKSTRGKHPPILYLINTSDAEAKDLPRLVEDADKETWTFDCAIPNKKEDAKPIRLGIVIVGHSEDI